MNEVATMLGTDTAYAANLLKRGELVAIPTETVYGLAANALESAAVLKIFKAKDRPLFNPLIVHCAELEAAKNLVTHIPGWAQKLADAFMPGPVSLLLPKSERVPDLVTAGKAKVAIRVPRHPLTLELLRQIDFPLAAPSANPFGYVSPVTAMHVKENLEGKVAYILDGGPAQVGVESTILEEENGELIIRRTGGITPSMIEGVTGMKPQIQLAADQPSAPGMLKSHYATKKPLFHGNWQKVPQSFRGTPLLLLGWGNEDEIRAELPEHLSFNLIEVISLSPSKNPDEAAANLFAAMRLADASEAALILATRFPESGLGLAINDRLMRAAYPANALLP